MPGTDHLRSRSRWRFARAAGHAFADAFPPAGRCGLAEWRAHGAARRGDPRGETHAGHSSAGDDQRGRRNRAVDRSGRSGLGAASVRLLDVDEKRLDLARRKGFEAVQPDQAMPHSADCLFIATDAPAAMTALPGLIDFGGVAVVVGLLDETPINWLQTSSQEGTIMTARYFTLDDFGTGLDMLGRVEVDVSWLIQDQADFESVADQYGEALVNRARQVVRLVIIMPAANEYVARMTGLEQSQSSTRRSAWWSARTEYPILPRRSVSGVGSM